MSDAEDGVEMELWEVHAAVATYLKSGDTGPWLRVLEAIGDGSILATTRKNSLMLSANVRPAARVLAQRLTRLRAESGVLMADLAEALDISLSSVNRQLAGKALGSWPNVVMMVQAMGGDPADFRADYTAAKAEVSRKRSSDE